MNIHPLFPTPIGTFFNFIKEKERLVIWDRIKNIPHISHEAIEGDGYSTHQKNLNFLDKKIKDRIQTALDEYNEACGYYPSTLAKVWSNIQNSGSKLNQHSHPGSHVSGALYINVGEDATLYFHNPNPYVYFTPRKDLTSYNIEYQAIGVKNCELVLFPSWLRHGNDNVINKMDGRIVVSFNSVSN